MKAVQRVLDAYCLIAYFENEDGAEEMIEIFKAARDSGQDLLLSVINWGEVYFISEDPRLALVRPMTSVSRMS